MGQPTLTGVAGSLLWLQHCRGCQTRVAAGLDELSLWCDSQLGFAVERDNRQTELALRYENGDRGVVSWEHSCKTYLGCQDVSIALGRSSDQGDYQSSISLVKQPVWVAVWQRPSEAKGWLQKWTGSTIDCQLLATTTSGKLTN